MEVTLRLRSRLDVSLKILRPTSICKTGYLGKIKVYSSKFKRVYYYGSEEYLRYLKSLVYLPLSYFLRVSYTSHFLEF